LFTTTKFQDFEIREFEILDSTNLHAKNICKEVADKIVIFANKQTSGKGRGGKEWFSDEGNLFFSVILDVKKIANSHLISLISALIISDICTLLGTKTQVKWPNDVLINGKKVCGILLEKVAEKLIIGVGVNIISNPEYLDSGKVSTSLKHENIIVDKIDFLHKFLHLLNAELTLFQNNGFAEFKTRIIAKLYKLNENIELDYLGTKFAGKILNISDNGNLILELNGHEGTKEFNIGEIL
jgi:BirA family biotin operon repressor/biotin-[acetyl-CoA-carboxylase] ligase